MANRLKPFTDRLSIWELRDWANEELRAGNRIKAGKLNRLADKYNMVQADNQKKILHILIK